MGPSFQKVFWGLFTTSHDKNPKIVKSGLYSEKNPEKWVPFSAKMAVKKG